MSSTRTAEACHVPGDALAKAVVLRRDGGYMMADPSGLPPSASVSLEDASSATRSIWRAKRRSRELFDDCERGAIPPVGECYGLDVIIDSSIDTQREIYMEGGDHATLIHLDREQFARLTAKARHGHFTTHD